MSFWQNNWDPDLKPFPLNSSLFLSQHRMDHCLWNRNPDLQIERQGLVMLCVVWRRDLSRCTEIPQSRKMWLSKVPIYSKKISIVTAAPWTDPSTQWTDTVLTLPDAFTQDVCTGLEPCVATLFVLETDVMRTKFSLKTLRTSQLGGVRQLLTWNWYLMDQVRWWINEGWYRNSQVVIKLLSHVKLASALNAGFDYVSAGERSVSLNHKTFKQTAGTLEPIGSGDWVTISSGPVLTRPQQSHPACHWS